MDDTPDVMERDGADEAAPKDLVLELNFVPTWARTPPRTVEVFPGDNRRPGPHREDSPRRDTRPHGPRDGRPGRAPGTRSGSGQPGRGQPRPDRDSRARPRPPEPREPPLPFVARVLPEQKHLSAVVHRIHKTSMAFPLTGLTAFFLAHPELCYLRLDPVREAGTALLYQCQTCGMLALDRPALVSHLLRKHFEEHFQKEDISLEAPTGSFVCVARCTRSGVLLGPPNHHSYAEKVQELHRTRFSHLTKEEFASRIEIVRDPALVEQWKQGAQKQTLYRLRRDGRPTEEKLNWSAAEALFLRDIAPALITEARRVVVAVSVAREIEDRRLFDLARDAWQQEERYPRCLSSALRAAFRHKHLHLFRAGQGREFVTTCRPAPLDPAHVVESIREVLLYLHDHPGCTRRQMVEGLRPGTAFDSPEATKVLSPLSWLVEKGHIIEFSDGTLAVPLREGREGATKA